VRLLQEQLPPWVIGVGSAAITFGELAGVHRVQYGTFRRLDVADAAFEALLLGLYAFALVRRSRAAAAGDDAALVYPSRLEWAVVIAPLVLMALGAVVVVILLAWDLIAHPVHA
jgi:hypothetical protein